MTDSELKLFNSLSRQKETFVPQIAGQVSMYVCGVTVYDRCHLGHARCYIAFDVIVRHLQSLGYTVNYVRNITDVDDKIIARASAASESMSALTDRMIAAFKSDMAALGLLSPNHEPRATHHISEMLALIDTLLNKGFAYQGQGGDVYFDVNQFKAYGRLSKKDLQGQQHGLRISTAEDKRHPLDFVLWKMAKPGEIAWNSPWGKGRPGWHIECSAMCKHCLGTTVDIHGGGFDLQFPHHENELAQSEAASSQTMARFWLHTGFLNINQQKMSKSLGNFLTIEDTLNTYHPEVLKLFFLSTHYRKPLDFNQSQLEQAKANLKRFYRIVADHPLAHEISSMTPEATAYKQSFDQAMNDDINTPKALAVLFELAKACQDKEVDLALVQMFKQLGQRLGLLQHSPETFFAYHIQQSDLSDVAIEALVAQRQSAREQKDWAQADKIRQQLLDNQVEISDIGGETRWRRMS